MKVSDELKKNYVKWTQKAVADIRAAIESLRGGAGDRDALIKAIFAISHDIKGMGASFDYPLMTEAGQALCGYISETGTPEHCRLERLDQYCAVLERVIGERLSGESGARGRAIMAELAAIAEDPDSSGV